MAQEEHTPKYSSCGGGGGESGSASGDGGGGGGGKSSKKLKQKKVPQRGLGVAQLEKIRLEEQHRKEIAVQAAAALSPNSITSTNSSCLGVQCANYRHTLPPPPIPLPRPPSLTNISSSNSLFRAPPPNPNPNADPLHLNCTPFSPPPNGCCGEIGWLPVLSSCNLSWPKLWHCEYNLEGENNRLDNNGFSLHSNLSLPYGICSPPHVMHRAQHQQSSSSSSMVNVSSGTLSSSVINFQMEPPSNQSYYSSSYVPMWPDEDKMIGIKRAYVFAIDNPAASTTSQSKFPPTYVAPTYRSDDSASCGNGGAFNIEAGNPISREGLSSSATRYERNLKRVTKETGGLSGNFLTLASPAFSLPRLSSNYNTHSAPAASQSHELSKIEPLPYRGSMEEPAPEQGERGFIQQKPFYSFLHLAKAHVGQKASSTLNSHGEVGGGVDLSLKL